MNLSFCNNTSKRIIYYSNHFLFVWNNYICHSQARFLQFKEFTITEISIFLNNNIKYICFKKEQTVILIYKLFSVNSQNL